MNQNWWINDPDCLLLRPDTELTEAEIKAHATLIGLSAGSLIISDDLSKLPFERVRVAAVLLPLMRKRPMVMDWFDRLTPQRIRLDLDGPIGHWKLLAYFNWEDHSKQAILRRADYGLTGNSLWVRSFWSNKLVNVDRSETVWNQSVPPHGVVLLAVYQNEGENPQYLGSNLHISQGQEVQKWCWDENELMIELGLNRKADGYIEIYLPKIPKEVRLDTHQVNVVDLSNGIYQIPVSFINHQKINIHFE
jgi:alpha-galactosidase